ncbi:MAG TPA: flagellin [Caulobacter sp.]|nr:flagellin [Caulobacter sp.]
MNRVATGNSYSTVLNDLMRAQVRQQEANAQVSSGKTASDLKGFSRQAESLLATRSIQTKIDGFLTQGQTLTSKLESQDLALNQTADAAAGARQAIAEALATGRGEALMGELSSWFSSASDSLNARFGGRYLFAGGQVDTPPVTAAAMADLTSQPSVAAFFNNDNLAPASQLDESTTIQSGFLADQLGTGLFDAFRQVQAFVDANGDFTGQLSAAQSTFLQGMLGQFETARSSLTDATARNGLIQNRVDKTMETQEARKAMLEGMVGGITDVDMAEAISRLQQAQTTVQASAQVFNTLSQSSLLDLLQP